MQQLTDDKQLMQEVLSITNHLILHLEDNMAWAHLIKITANNHGGCVIGTSHDDCSICAFGSPTEAKCDLVRMGFYDVRDHIPSAKRLEELIQFAGYLKSHL